MSFREKQSIVNMISALLIAGIYFWYVFQSDPLVGLNTNELLHFWAKTILIYIPVTLGARIIIHILFTIGDTVATQEKEFEQKEDERDKLIELKSNRNAHWVFGMGFVLGLVALVMDKSVNVLFVIMVIAGILTEIFENVSKLYYYRKGI